MSNLNKVKDFVHLYKNLQNITDDDFQKWLQQDKMQSKYCEPQESAFRLFSKLGLLMKNYIPCNGNFSKGTYYPIKHYKEIFYSNNHIIKCKDTGDISDLTFIKNTSNDNTVICATTSKNIKNLKSLRDLDINDILIEKNNLYNKSLHICIVFPDKNQLLQMDKNSGESTKTIRDVIHDPTTTIIDWNHCIIFDKLLIIYL